MHQHVLQFNQPAEVFSNLGIAPADRFAQVPPGETKRGPGNPLFRHFALHILVQASQQGPCLRRQFIQAPSEHLTGNPVGHRDVSRLDLDVWERFSTTPCLGPMDGPLVLVQ